MQRSGDLVMGFKDILTIVSYLPDDEPAFVMAEQLAAQFQAHLSCAVLTALPDEPLAYEPTVVAGVWAELLGRARAESETHRAAIEARVARSGVACEMRRAEALGRDLGRVAAVHARYADLVVLAHAAVSEGREARSEMIEGVLFHSGRPVLVAPKGWTGSPLGKRIVIAWDASREATRAVSEARPFLAGCEAALVLTVDAKPRAFGHGDQPGQNIASHLSRRGVKVEVRNADSMGRAISDALLQEAESYGADLMVMGAYGHSRLRELVFGGATRELLDDSRLPLFMAH
jgi:nucleotide-binding universal stress UspA family protein